MKPEGPHPHRVLFLEAYPGQSHLRTLELLKEYSRHSICGIVVERDHWKSLALLSHLELANAIWHTQPVDVDLIIVSGQTDLPALLGALPPELQHVPVVSYIHENQWSYPDQSDNVQPFQVQHINTMRASTELWFNSQYHAEDFFKASQSSRIERRIRQAARQAVILTRDKARVLYPPVMLTTPLVSGNQGAPRILWNARWEHDKSPETFITALRALSQHRPGTSVLILGTGGVSSHDIRQQIGDVNLKVDIAGHVPDRLDYERHLAGNGIVVSTANHEFFGIGVLEAVLAGHTPVLPAALAYPETLPSAWFYDHGDTQALVSTVVNAMQDAGRTRRLHQSDAARFLAPEAVTAWDAQIDRVVRTGRSDR